MRRRATNGDGSRPIHYAASRQVLEPGSCIVNEAERIAHVESLVMHLQYEVEQLSRAVLEQQSEISLLRSELRKFRSDLDEPAAAPRDPVAEKPPHY